VHSFSLDILCTLFPWTGKDSRFGTLLAEVHSASKPALHTAKKTAFYLAPAARRVAQGGLDKMAAGFTQCRLHASDAAE
jgi:hypothetical protein